MASLSLIAYLPWLQVVACRALAITHDDGEGEEEAPLLSVHLSDGSVLRAPTVICCTGLGRARIPAWAQPFRLSLPDLPPSSPPTILHASELPAVLLHQEEGRGAAAAAAFFRGKSVIVVGGGLTAAHLLLLARE